MAYDATRKEKDQQDEGANPYESALSAYGAPSGSPSGSFGTIRPQATSGPSAPAGPDMLNAGGPTATGHVNFDQMYNANAGVAQREAGKRADAVERAGASAVQGRTGAQQNFANATRTGATQGPAPEQYEYATGQRAFYGADAPTARSAPVNALQQRDTGPRVTPDPTEADWLAQMRTAADRKFSGPDALSSMNGYDDLLKQTVAAQDLAKNPLTGLGETDRMLLGATGGERRSELAAKYGDLTKQLDAANTASIAQAKDAKAVSDAAQSDYERLLKDYEATRPEPEKGPEPIRIGAASNNIGVAPEIRDAWEQLEPEDRLHKLGGDRTYEQASSMADKFLTGVLMDYGVDKETADAIRDNLTQEDWVGYQQAVAQGYDAFVAWIQKMQAKARAGAK